MSPVTTPNPRDQRTYYVSDERLRAFAKLSYAQRLHWVEQCSQFVRLAQQAMAKDNKLGHVAVGLIDPRKMRPEQRTSGCVETAQSGDRKMPTTERQLLA